MTVSTFAQGADLPMRGPRLPPALTVLTLMLAMGCQPLRAELDADSGAGDPAGNGDSRPAESASAANPDYRSLPGARQECLGRLLFDASQEMDWGVNEPGTFKRTSLKDQYGFPEGLQGGRDRVQVGNLQILVSAPVGHARFEEIAEKAIAGKSEALAGQRAWIDQARKSLASMDLALQDGSAAAISEDNAVAVRKASQDLRASIDASERNLGYGQARWGWIDAGMPGVKAYMAGPLNTVLYSGGRVYSFGSTEGEGRSLVVRDREFQEAIKSFRPRDRYSIPKDPGICIPYGFMSDKGATAFHTEMSVRYADRPGVIYTISTGITGVHPGEAPQPAALRATARANVGVLGRGGVAGRVIESVGPRRVRIGVVPAVQGGIVLDTADEGAPAVPSYSVYTAYDGKTGSQVAPYIKVEMRSFTRMQVEALDDNPPPFAESKQRLDLLLKSIRLRPTTKGDPAQLQ